MLRSDVIKIPSISFPSTRSDTPFSLFLSPFLHPSLNTIGDAFPWNVFFFFKETRDEDEKPCAHNSIENPIGNEERNSNISRFSYSLGALINPLSIRSHAFLAPAKSQSAKANVYKDTQVGSSVNSKRDRLAIVTPLI